MLFQKNFQNVIFHQWAAQTKFKSPLFYWSTAEIADMNLTSQKAVSKLSVCLKLSQNIAYNILLCTALHHSKHTYSTDQLMKHLNFQLFWYENSYFRRSHKWSQCNINSPIKFLSLLVIICVERMKNPSFGHAALRELVLDCSPSQSSVAIFAFVFQGLVSWLAIWCRALSHTMSLTGADREETEK